MEQTSISNFFSKPNKPNKTVTTAQHEPIIVIDSDDEVAPHEAALKRKLRDADVTAPPAKRPRHASLSSFALGSVREPDQSREARQRHDRLKGKFLGPAALLSRNETPIETDVSHAPAVAKAKGVKYTPLECQILDFKRENPDLLLLIEVGYKFMFYAEDAVIASKILGIAHFWSKNMFTAMVPVPRLYFHVKRLLQAGHQVGIVRQTESAALKKASDSRNVLFERKLVEKYTLGTYIDDLDTEEAFDSSTGGTTLFILEEAVSNKKGIDEVTQISLAAIEAKTGDVYVDSFTDTFLRSELEVRLLQLRPIEIWYAEGTSSATVSLIKIHSASRFDTTSLRVATFSAKPFDRAFTQLNRFFCSLPSTSEITAADPLIDLEKNVVVVLHALYRHLQRFELLSLLQPNTIRRLGHKGAMLLTGSTLRNLAIFESESGNPNKSLFGLLNNCKTPFGTRLLRKWLLKPLTNKDSILERQACIAEIMDAKDPAYGRLRGLMSGLPDLEKALARMTTGRLRPQELLKMLLAFTKVCDLPDSDIDVFRSLCFKRAVGLKDRLENPTQTALGSLEKQAALENSIAQLFKSGVDRELDELKVSIQDAEEHLKEELRNIRTLLKKPALSYTTIADEEYLIELRQAETKHVPAHWLKINSTKSHYRYRSPEIQALMEQKGQAVERLEAAGQRFYQAFLKDLASNLQPFLDAIRVVAEIDCLFSLATYSTQYNCCRPVFAEEPNIVIKEARHPMLEAFSSTPFVPNDISFNDDQRVMVLTSANMSGKSTYARMAALIVILAQVGCFVPATSCHLPIHDAIFTRMGASDQMIQKRSTFMVELLETSEMLRAATHQSLLVLDELGRGSSTTDGQAIAHAVLHHLTEHVKATTIFTTHYFELAYHRFPGCQVWHMQLTEDRGGVSFLYELCKGPITNSHGINVAALAGIPTRVVDRASRIAKIMEDKFAQQVIAALLKGLMANEENDGQFLEWATARVLAHSA